MAHRTAPSAAAASPPGRTPTQRLTAGELFIELRYRTPVIPSLVQVYQSGNPGGIIRVELLDSASGLGSLIYEAAPAPSDPCLQTLSIPVQDTRVHDTVIITMAHSETPTYIDAVELVGEVPGWQEHPVLWQIPVLSGSLLGRPSLPGSIAAGSQGDLYLANGRHGLYRFDASGRELKRFAVPTEANLSDLAPAPDGKLLITDTAYRWWILLNAGGIQDGIGGEDFAEGNPMAAAFGPTWEDIYLLDQGGDSARIRVYDALTAEVLRDLDLEAGPYRSLAVDVDGLIYTLETSRGLIQQLDPGDGNILDSYGYQELPGTDPVDLSLDDMGNIYVLLQSSPDDSAVYIYDKKGTLTARMGQLVASAEQRQPGFFYQPASITVTPDGKRLFILEPGLITAYSLQ